MSGVPLSWRVRVAMARWRQRAGWAGMAGAVLLALACAVLAWAGVGRLTAGPLPSGANADAALPAAVPASGALRAPPPAPALPRRDALAGIVTLIERTSESHGLGWPAAEYRVVPATADRPASLEVRCNLKGTYPHLRALVADLLESLPTFTLREFHLSRPNSDTAEVDARLVMMVFFQDAPPTERAP